MSNWVRAEAERVEREVRLERRWHALADDELATLRAGLAGNTKVALSDIGFRLMQELAEELARRAQDT